MVLLFGQTPQNMYTYSTPTAGLECLTGVPLLDLHIQEIAIQTSTRHNLHPSDWSGVNKRNKLDGHIKWLQSQMKGLPPKEMQDRCVIPITHHKFTTFIGVWWHYHPWCTYLHWWIQKFKNGGLFHSFWWTLRSWSYMAGTNIPRGSNSLPSWSFHHWGSNKLCCQTRTWFHHNIQRLPVSYPSCIWTLGQIAHCI